MIVDAHTHISRLQNSDFEAATFAKNFERLLREMKANRVDHAMLLPWYENKDPRRPSMHGLLELGKGVKQISVVGAYDVEAGTPSDLAELDALLRERKIVGVKLYTGYQHFYPSDARCAPVYKLCERYGAPVIFHSGDTLKYKTSAKVKYAHPLNIDEVAVDHPDLKIIIAHLGNPWLVDTAEVLYRNDNVYADLSGLVLGDDLGSPYGKMMKQRIRELMLYASPRKLLYGTDWPLAPIKSYIKFVKGLGIKKNDLEYVMWKNAADLFKIKI